MVFERWYRIGWGSQPSVDSYPRCRTRNSSTRTRMVGPAIAMSHTNNENHFRVSFRWLVRSFLLPFWRQNGQLSSLTFHWCEFQTKAPAPFPAETQKCHSSDDDMENAGLEWSPVLECWPTRFRCFSCNYFQLFTVVSPSLPLSLSRGENHLFESFNSWLFFICPHCCGCRCCCWFVLREFRVLI